MADLLSLFRDKLLGGPVFPPAEIDGDAPFQPSDRTTIAGMPVLPLGTAAGLAGLFALLGKKGYKRQAALQGGLLGYNIGNAPVLHEQKQQDELMKQALESGQIELASAPPPVNLHGPVPPGQGALVGTPPSPPSFTYGGAQLHVTPKVTIGDTFGMGVPEGLRNVRISANVAGAAAPALIQDARNRAWVVSQGLDPNTPIESAIAQAGEARRLKQSEDWLRTKGQLGPNQSLEQTMGPNGPTVGIKTKSAADIAAEAELRTLRQRELDVTNKQLENAIQRGASQDELAKLEIAQRTAELKFREANVPDPHTAPLTTQIEQLRRQDEQLSKDMAGLRGPTGEVPEANIQAYNALAAQRQRIQTDMAAAMAQLGTKAGLPAGTGPAPIAATPAQTQSGVYLKQILTDPDGYKKNIPTPRTEAERHAMAMAEEIFAAKKKEIAADLTDYKAQQPFYEFGIGSAFDKNMTAKYGDFYPAGLRAWRKGK